MVVLEDLLIPSVDKSVDKSVGKSVEVRMAQAFFCRVCRGFDPYAKLWTFDCACGPTWIPSVNGQATASRKSVRRADDAGVFVQGVPCRCPLPTAVRTLVKFTTFGCAPY